MSSCKSHFRSRTEWIAFHQRLMTSVGEEKHFYLAVEISAYKDDFTQCEQICLQWTVSDIYQHVDLDRIWIQYDSSRSTINDQAKAWYLRKRHTEKQKPKGYNNTGYIGEDVRQWFVRLLVHYKKLFPPKIVLLWYLSVDARVTALAASWSNSRVAHRVRQAGHGSINCGTWGKSQNSCFNIFWKDSYC